MKSPQQPESWQTCALIALALEDPRGLESVVDFQLSKTVVEGLARQLSIGDLLERINGSLYSGELLAYLPKALGPTKESLQPVVDALLSDDFGKWDDCDLRKFADAYWKAMVGERLARGDIRRAWDNAKKAFRGFSVLEYAIEAAHEVPSHGEPQELAASRRHCVDFIKTVYEILYKQGLVPLVSNALLTKSEMAAWTGRAPRKEPLPGELFARVFAEKGTFGPISQMIVAIACYFAEQRDAKRQKHAAEQQAHC